MADHSESSRFQVLFESALQNYQNQTGTTLSNHPLAEKLQYCDSVESVTAVLQEQARAFTEFRGDDGKFMKSLKGIVSVLYTLSAGTALGEAIGLVCTNALMEIPHLMLHLAAFPTRKSHIYWPRHSSRCMILIPYVYILVTYNHIRRSRTSAPVTTLSSICSSRSNSS